VEVPRKIALVEQLKKELESSNPNVEVKLSSDVRQVSEADIVVAATNAPEAVITSSCLKRGAVVVDDAQPSDVDEQIIKEREDVLVLEGGVVETPGIKVYFDFGLAKKSDNFSCLGEVLALSSVGWKGDYALGRLDESLIEKIVKMAEKLNFKPGAFQNSYKIYSKEDIEKVKAARAHAF
jgi:predicted amino acid dehydrogenase